ncbi:hypothetical protein, conserved [Plasmodium vivax]|uniref:Protein AMR3 n=1 Tax=Plasmodium vivax (strain Salvador I) TaxID=126793 RepID=A5JZ43_PLAVS|nr:hypothetical protein, conserved [Plasmodium vivax]EDL47254.1 hypothetical protein, conserved [Plasmodium vivax]|eukprot:XP_001616981.1 hypothetical protein [Plasmodium vivax Sal-1]
MRFPLITFNIVLTILTQLMKNLGIAFLHTCGANKVAEKAFHQRGSKRRFHFLTTQSRFKEGSKLFMTKKFKYKYKNSLERRIRKGRIRNEINQKLKKKHSAYIMITEKLSKLDPEQKYFKYDKNILKEYENIKNIYKNRKLGRKFNQFDYWYSSKKKEARYNYSRHVNFTITENKFNFKNVFSYFHILEVVHEKFKNNAFYINGLQSFINKYYDPVTQKRIKYYDKIREQLEMRKKNGGKKSEAADQKEGASVDDGASGELKQSCAPPSSDSSEEGVKDGQPFQEGTLKSEDKTECTKVQAEKDTSTLKKDTSTSKRDDFTPKKDTSTPKKEFFEMIQKNLSEFEYSNEVSEDSSFKLFGSPTSCLLKKNGPIAYDIKNPFMKSKMSSKRRRFKERKLFDIINFKCKNKQERLMQTAVRKLAKRKMKDEKYILDPMEPA